MTVDLAANVQEALTSHAADVHGRLDLTELRVGSMINVTIAIRSE